MEKLIDEERQDTIEAHKSPSFGNRIQNENLTNDPIDYTAFKR